MRMVKRVLLRLYKTTQAVIANAVFGFPGRRLRVVGITGTDGKTTTVHLIVNVLESAGYTVGAISTIQYQVGTRIWTNTSKLTTPGPWELQKLLAHMVRAGCHYAVVECSSHRLDQGGLWGIPLDVAVITNITREHFDYHRDFDDYAAAKRRLFRLLDHPAKVLPYRPRIDPGGKIPTAAVANLDDERARTMLDGSAEKKYGFTLWGIGVRPSAVEQQAVTLVAAESVPADPDARVQNVESALYVVRAGEHEALLRLQLPGLFNLANALAAIAVGVSLGIELARITRGLSDIKRIPGRMDAVDRGQPFHILVDYAVTPAAFERVYTEISNRKRPRCKVIHVFGAAGGRDRGKRRLLGHIAGRNADLVILTDEDPFDEDPERILNDIEVGLNEAGSRGRRSVIRIRDRRLAIREALKRAQPGDSVLVTGKGAEETMAVAKRRIAWNDRRVIEEELASLIRHDASAAHDH